MKILELQEYAERNGFDSVEFEFEDFTGVKRKGKWIDAYFGMFTISDIGNRFITVQAWRNEFGNEIEFSVL